MSLRLLTKADLESYHSVLHHGYQQTKEFPISFEAADYSKEDSLKWLEAHPTYGWLDEELTSVLSLRMPWGAEPGPYGVPHIGHFTTHPNYSGKGYGRQLYQQVEQEILKKQLRTPFVTLGTAASHPWLNEMYQRFGFHEIARKQLTGKQHITIYYQKDL
jgi:GNAT superfamily N-acetyltransferase